MMITFLLKQGQLGTYQKEYWQIALTSRLITQRPGMITEAVANRANGAIEVRVDNTGHRERLIDLKAFDRLCHGLYAHVQPFDDERVQHYVAVSELLGYVRHPVPFWLHGACAVPVAGACVVSAADRPVLAAGCLLGRPPWRLLLYTYSGLGPR